MLCLPVLCFAVSQLKDTCDTRFWHTQSSKIFMRSRSRHRGFPVTTAPIKLGGDIRTSMVYFPRTSTKTAFAVLSCFSELVCPHMNHELKINVGRQPLEALWRLMRSDAALHFAVKSTCGKSLECFILVVLRSLFMQGLLNRFQM